MSYNDSEESGVFADFYEFDGGSDMKRLLWPICIVLIAIVLFSGFGGTDDVAFQDPSSVSEAAFSMRTSGYEDVTSFLVGRFVGDGGTSLRFDGAGGVTETSASLDLREGTAILTQSKGGAALLQLSIGGTSQLYSFQLISAEGAFTLTDADGNSETFQPMP